MTKTNDYIKNGISAHKEKHGIKVTYNGLLAQSGADKVYAVYGFGSNWVDQSVHQMMKTNHGFEISLPSDDRIINVAFKDSANNWDNNSGRNYSFYTEDSTKSHFWE